MYQVIVFIHIISAITWLGGMLFLAMVMVPLARRDPESVGFNATAPSAAEKFVRVAWASMIVLAGSGVLPGVDAVGDSAGRRSSPVSDWPLSSQLPADERRACSSSWSSSALAHDFWLGPRMMDRLEAGAVVGHRTASHRIRPRLFVQWAARVNLLLVLAGSWRWPCVMTRP